MTQMGRRARVVHAIPGRLRIRFEGAGPEPSFHGLAAARVAPGVLAIETKPAARSAVVRYDPAATTEAAVLEELDQAGIELISLETVSVVAPDASSPDSVVSKQEAGTTSAPRDSQGRFQRKSGDPRQGAPEGQTADPKAGPKEGKAGERSALMEMLIGPPPKLDRRFAESLALSAVSLLAARRVGLALGGGTTLPAYFAIWFALRRLTGAGRRR
jgi:hypothetical protein